MTGLLTLDRPKVTKNLPQAELTKKARAEWDGRGMKLNGVTNMEIKFSIHVIAHKMYKSSQQNSVPCEAMDPDYKVVNKNLSFDLVEF